MNSTPAPQPGGDPASNPTATGGWQTGPAPQDSFDGFWHRPNPGVEAGAEGSGQPHRNPSQHPHQQPSQSWAGNQAPWTAGAHPRVDQATTVGQSAHGVGHPEAFAVRGTDGAGWPGQGGAGQPTQADDRPTARPRRAVMGLLALALVAAGIGGGTALGVNHYAAGDQASPTATQTVTKVVNTNGSAPDWSAVADAVTNSVVAIDVSTSRGQGQGSGVVWDKKGHIVTNNHVVAGAGSGGKIAVKIGDVSYAATVVGTDPASDLAVIKLTDPPTNLVPIGVAKGSPEVGDPVMAIGNPLGLSSTVTTGIVSALNRPVTTQAEQGQQGQGEQDLGGQQGTNQSSTSATVVTNAVQTSAPINPGNSGGALVNANGELVGINSSIASLSSSSGDGQSGSIGIGFAIGAPQVSWVVEELISSGKVTHSTLGVRVSDVETSGSGTTQLGAKVASVDAGSSAERAGLKSGDVVTALNGAPVESAESLIAQVRGIKPDTTVKVTINRSGKTLTVDATLKAS